MSIFFEKVLEERVGYSPLMYLLEPRSVALIGASDDERKLGCSILKNLIGGTYKGEVFPVNPKHREMMGKRCFTSIDAIPERVDLAVIVTPAITVCALAEECGRKKVKTLVVISAGFGELGTEEGKAREAELASIVKKHTMCLIGPNCLGILRPCIGLNASFAATPSKEGSIALISQSGAMAVALLDSTEGSGMAFSLIASIGNKATMNESDFLEICEKDVKTEVIGLYLESIKDGKHFTETAKRVGKKKPIVLIKAGVSKRGAKAVSSHTGALAGSNAALTAACEAAGIHHAQGTEEFLDLLSVLSTEPTLLSPAIAIITNAGGPGVLATDAAEREKLTLPDLDSKTKEILKKALPEAASRGNPVDILGDAKADRYKAALHACAQDQNVDGIVVLLTPQVMTPCEDIAKVVVESKKSHSLIPIVPCFMGGPAIEGARKIFAAQSLPCFRTPETAIRAIGALQKKTPHASLPVNDDRDDDRSSAASGILKGQNGLLPEELTEDLFQLYDLPTPDQAVAKNADEAATLAAQIGYPVIAKVSSPDILHKTDIGGVRTNLQSAADVKKAYEDILKNCGKAVPSAGIRGVLIQQFLPIGNEFIIGGIRDENFGPLVMVGLGGIYTELFRDTCFALAPVTIEQAYDMLSSLKSWKLLTGMRGKGALDIESLAKAVVQISVMLHNCSKISEIDLNPVLVGKDRIVVADAKVVLETVSSSIPYNL